MEGTFGDSTLLMKAGLPLKLDQVAHYIVQWNFQYLKGLPAFLVISHVTLNVLPSIQLQNTVLFLVTVYFFFFPFCSASSYSLRQKSAITVCVAGQHSRLQTDLEISNCAGDTFSVEVEQAN